MRSVSRTFLFGDAGEVFQPVIIEGTYLPADAEIIVTIGRTSYSRSARDACYGPMRYRVGVPPVDAVTEARVAIVDGRDRNDLNTVTLDPPRRQVAHLLHHAHQDAGWGDRPTIMRDRMTDYLHSALDLAEATSSRSSDERFRWNVESMYLVTDFLAACTASDSERLFAAMRNGQIEVGALYAGVEGELHSLAQLTRITAAAIRLRDEHDVPVMSAFLNDVPGWPGTLPSVLSMSGIRYFVWGPDPIRAMTHLSELPSLFYAQAPDARRVLVHQAPFAYIDAFPLAYRDADGAEDFIERLMSPYRDVTEYPRSHVLLHTAHDFNPPFGSLADLVRDWNARWLYPHLRMSLARDYFPLALAEPFAVPTVAGTFPDAWTDGVGSAAAHVGRKRAAARRLAAAQTTAACSQVFDPEQAVWEKRIASMFPPMAMRLAKRPWLDYPEHEIEEAYSALHLLDEHTWGSVEGADNYHGYTRAHWLEREALIFQAENQAEIVELSAGTFLAREAGVGERSLTLFNPHPWPRQGLESLRVPIEWLGGDDTIVDVESGQALEHEIDHVDTDQDAATVLVVTPEVPAFGYRSLSWQKRGAEGPLSTRRTTHGFELSNAHCSISVDPRTGGLTSWRDAEGRQLVDQSARFTLNQFILHLRDEVNQELGEFDEFDLTGAETWKIAADIGRGLVVGEELVASDVEATCLHGALRSTISVSSSVSAYVRLQTDYTLERDSATLLIENRLNKLGRHPREAAYFAFPFALLDGEFEIEGPGYTFRPGEQLSGSMYDHYTVNEWVRLTSREHQILIAPIDCPLVNAGGIHTDRWMRQPDTRQSHLYSYAFNHSWWTNFPTKQVGHITSRFALSSGPVTPRSSCHEFASTRSTPTQGFTTTGERAYGALRPTGRFWDITGAQAFSIEAIGSGPHHRGFIIGLLETEGESSTAEITLVGQRSVTSARKVDLCRSTLEILEFDGNTVRLELSAHELTFVELTTTRPKVDDPTEG